MTPSRLRGLSVALAVAAGLLGRAAGQTDGEPATSLQTAHRFERSDERRFDLPYLLYLPQEYGQDARQWPLILHLPGGLARGTRLADVLSYPLPKRLEQERSFPFVVLSPQCPDRQTWIEQAAAVMALLDEIVVTHAIDPTRIYIMGHQMGGTGAWYLAHRHPERFAAIAPVSAPALTYWGYTLVDTPVWAFHGAKDANVRLAEAQGIVDFLRARGGKVELTVYPEGTHFVTEPFEGQEVYDWFLTHRRGVDAPPAAPTP